MLINNLFEDPLAGRTIYLATIITSNDGLMEMARFDITTAPQAITDENGQFTFTNVEPGRYGAILGGAINDYLLADFRTQEEVVFTLEPNQVLDLGEIWITPPEG
ncbi:MAG: hypothetical protein JW963_17835 [Anaerolineales bacterium]|nr:hypothetical protein [Anaerolineales bacterium]